MVSEIRENVFHNLNPHSIRKTPCIYRGKLIVNYPGETKLVEFREKKQGWLATIQKTLHLLKTGNCSSEKQQLVSTYTVHVGYTASP